MSKIGFIGLGIMGKPMLRNLRKAGHELIAYDVSAASLDAVVGDGVERGALLQGRGSTHGDRDHDAPGWT